MDRRTDGEIKKKQVERNAKLSERTKNWFVYFVSE